MTRPNGIPANAYNIQNDFPPGLESKRKENKQLINHIQHEIIFNIEFIKLQIDPPKKNYSGIYCSIFYYSNISIVKKKST